jgi:hypothetical protein
MGRSAETGTPPRSVSSPCQVMVTTGSWATAARGKREATIHRVFITSPSKSVQ